MPLPRVQIRAPDIRGKEMEFPIEWQGWYFAEGLLVSPNGDVFSPQTILACTFYRQMKEVKMMIYPPTHSVHWVARICPPTARIYSVSGQGTWTALRSTENKSLNLRIYLTQSTSIDYKNQRSIYALNWFFLATSFLKRSKATFPRILRRSLTSV